ncbi:MAG: FHA domain-containing protein [Chloroflexi bacterium]|nr:FHA domain-containing protein [Chloroflexota bacterium]
MAQFQFVMRSGPTPGVTFPLEGEQLTIGRDSTNGVAINDAEVSRKHARLMFQGGKFVLEDLGSTNGTFVNGQRLAGPVVLKPGDVVSLGEQIVLMYDAIAADPGATVAVSRKAAQQMAQAPAYSAPAPSYSPPPAAHASAPAAPKKTNMLPIFIGIGALLLICACAGFFWWVDATYRWCVLFPFISGC